MGIRIRFVGEVAVLSDLGRLMNDPKYFDVIREIHDLIDEGFLRFVMEMNDVREIGPTVFGLLTTMTRKIRQEDGEMVLAELSPPIVRYLDEMQMDGYWDVFEDAEAAIAFLERRRVGKPTVYE